jgi:hypothetical protein
MENSAAAHAKRCLSEGERWAGRQCRYRNQSSSNDCLIEFKIQKYEFGDEILPSRDIFRKTAISLGVTEYRPAPATKRRHVVSRLLVRVRGNVSGAKSG